MRLHNLFNDLANGELSNLAMAANLVDGVITSDQKKIVIYANDALLRLYSRFVLKERDIIIVTQRGITNYHFDSRFSIVGHDKNLIEIPYIQDLPLEPFTNDVIKVISVYDSGGKKLPLNDAECHTSVYTPQANVLQVPELYDNLALSVLYQAKHVALSLDNLNEIIELPTVLHSALTAYISYKVYSHMNTQEATAKAQEHMSVYEGLVNEAFMTDTVSVSVSDTNTRFHKRGWI